jgi:hypothetical protein
VGIRIYSESYKNIFLGPTSRHSGSINLEYGVKEFVLNFPVDSFGSALCCQGEALLKEYE